MHTRMPACTHSHIQERERERVWHAHNHTYTHMHSCNWTLSCNLTCTHNNNTLMNAYEHTQSDSCTFPPSLLVHLLIHLSFTFQSDARNSRGSMLLFILALSSETGSHFLMLCSNLSFKSWPKIHILSIYFQVQQAQLCQNINLSE